MGVPRIISVSGVLVGIVPDGTVCRVCLGFTAIIEELVDWLVTVVIVVEFVLGEIGLGD